MTTLQLALATLAAVGLFLVPVLWPMRPHRSKEG